MKYDKWYLFHGAQELRVPIVPVATMEDIRNFEQLKAREYFVEIEHPVTGRLTYPGAPFKMGETPWQIRCPAPLLGEHNEEILSGRLSYTKEDIVRLREQGVI